MTFNLTLFIKNIDRWLTPFACRVGALISSLSFRSPVQHTVILRPGGMGDLILLTLAIKNLGQDPKDFFWVIETRSEPWAKHLGLSYSCWNQGLIRLLFQYAGKFKTVINTEQYFGLSQATALALKHREGKLYSFLTNRASAYSSHTTPYNHHGHEFLEFQALLAQFLFPKKPHSFHQVTSSSTVNSGNEVVFALGGLQYPSRRLSPDDWAVILQKHVSIKSPIIVVSGPNDVEYARAVTKRIGKNASHFSGNFEAVILRIRQAQLVVGMEGGLIHVASYYGIPAYAVFTSSSYMKWHPLGSGSAVITRNDLTCQPCAVFAQVPTCRYSFRCTDLSKAELISIKTKNSE